MVIGTARRAILLALFALLALPNAAQASLKWRSCADFHGIRCATLKVPLDRSGVDPGTVPLRIAKTGRAKGPTLMYLSGGPGGAGVSEMLGVIPSVPGLEKHFRLIGYDQRGTGRSGLLRCPRLEHDRHLRSTAAAEDCANRLGVARHHYTTADSVEDMEAIRRQLHVGKLTLFGISYGTELAIAYARAHPDHVKRLILDSTVDADDRDPFATVNFRAMAPTLRALCPAKCKGISSDPAADLAKLVAQLRAKPMQAFAYDSLGRSHRVHITPVALYDLMFDADYNPPLRAAIPIGVKAALAGDGALLARLIREAARLEDLGSPRDFSSARYATVCETTPLPWPAGTPFDQRPAVTQQAISTVAPNAFFPFDAQVVVDDEIDLCMRWPDVPRATQPAPLPYPPVATLLLQGAEDLRTPPEWSANVAARIPGAQRLVIRGVGHSTVSDPRDCAADAIMDFIARKKLPHCKRIPTGVPDVQSPPAAFESLGGVSGYPQKVGRTLRALLGAFQDIDLLISPVTLSTAGGDLRGGSWELRGVRLVLEDFQAVTGVTVSGGGDLRRTLRLRLGGTKGAHGKLVLGRKGRLTGRLDGHRIAVRLTAGASRVGEQPLEFRLPTLLR
jgi:pimeloyl-ACP methyl ester carboxylesterase